MTLIFPSESITSLFLVGERVKVELHPFYKKPPYEVVEGLIYQVRAEMPSLNSTKPQQAIEMPAPKFRYGISIDVRQFPQMRDLENKLYDVPEEYLMVNG